MADAIAGECTECVGYADDSRCAPVRGQPAIRLPQASSGAAPHGSSSSSCFGFNSR